MPERESRPPWIIRTYAGFGDARTTNQRFKENLRRGQTGLSVAFDLPTQNGYDPDARMATGEIGGCGVSIAHLGDMEELFEDIDLATTNTSMTINATAPYLLALYLVLAEQRGIPWHKLHGTVQNDLLKEFVARGTSIFTPDISLRLSADIIRFTSEHVPHWNPVNICGYHYMESGAGPKEEIGYAFGNALLVLDAIRPQLAPGDFDNVVRRISFFINSGIELVPEICKMRAYSALWPRLCREEYGLENIRFRAGCQVRSLSLTAQQPELNIVRIALEALPAILSAHARVNALQLPGFREALALPDAMEQTLSLRTQQILMYETGIADHPDIFDGNPFISALTEEFVAGGRTIALHMREMGYEAAIEMVSRNLTKQMAERVQRIDSGEGVVVGRNCFIDPVGLSEQLAPSPRTAQNAEFQHARCGSIRTWRARRKSAPWSESETRLRQSFTSGENIMRATLDFVRAGGTVGEWTSSIISATRERHRERLDLSSTVVKGNCDVLAIPFKLVLGKAGLDGHTNAIKTLAMACRNAGIEVVFAGTKLSPEALIKTAVEEDAVVLGVSCLSGAHLHIASELVRFREQMGVRDLRIALGGTIPEQDGPILKDMGIDLVISVANGGINDAVRRLAQLAGRTTSV